MDCNLIVFTVVLVGDVHKNMSKITHNLAEFLKLTSQHAPAAQLCITRLCVVKILQESLYKTLPSVGPTEVKVGCDDVSCHKCEFNDARFDHTPNRLKAERMVFFCIFEVRAPHLGLNEVSNYQSWLVSFLY